MFAFGYYFYPVVSASVPYGAYSRLVACMGDSSAFCCSFCRMFAGSGSVYKLAFIADSLESCASLYAITAANVAPSAAFMTHSVLKSLTYSVSLTRYI